MKHAIKPARRAALFAASLMSASAGVVGCSDVSSTEPDIRRPRTTSYNYANIFSDGLTELHVDTANGRIKITDAGGGNAIYLEYDVALMAEVMGAVDGITLGDMRAGLPHVTLQNLRSLYQDGLAAIASAQVKGLQLNLMRSMYNGYNCQQPIYVAHGTRPQTYVPNNGSGNGGSGGGGVGCDTVSQLWEISFDGGMTWYPFAIDRQVCVPVQ